MFEHGFSFEQWVVTPSDGSVSGPYGETKLEPRIMEVLVHLAANAGEVVARNDLIDRVWAGTVVQDEVLSRCIYQIRKALGESSRDARFLETIPKRGYRLNAAIKDLTEPVMALPASWRGGSPFRGLQTFDIEHAPVFFGRARATHEAVAALKQQAAAGKSFLLLLGASGVGKSSLARAGVMHTLLQRQAVPGIARWYYHAFRPGDDQAGPVAALLQALERALSAKQSANEAACRKLGDYETYSAARLAGLLDEILDGDEAIAVVVDQMEEVFSHRHIDDEQRRAFFDALEVLAGSGRCWIIATLRSDFYPQCVVYPALMRLKKGSGQYDVAPLRPGEILQTIRMPALAADLVFEKGEAGSLDEVLYEAAATEPKLLPLLEFTLQLLYDGRTPDGRLTFDAYEQLGGIEGSLARRAEAVFDALPVDQREMLPQVLARMVRVDDVSDRVSSSVMSSFPNEHARRLVEAFVAARLFSSGLDSREKPRIGFTHEALLTHWPRIREWVADNRDMIRTRGRVVIASERWVSEGKTDDLLLPTGKPLEEAVGLLDTPSIELDKPETEFIVASRTAANLKKLWKRAAIGGLAILAVSVAALAWQARSQRDLAIEQSALAEREAMAARQTAEFLIDIFEAADPNESTGGRLTAQHILDRGVERLDEGLVDQPALKTRLRALVARAYKGIGLYADSEALLQEAVAESSQLDDLSDRERLAIQFELADVYFQRGNFSASEALHANVLEERLELFGETDMDTVDSLSVRAHELWRNGELSEAEDLLIKVLELRREHFGDHNRLVLDTHSSLGTFYNRRGLSEQARAHFREVVAMAPLVYGQRSFGTALALSNLAYVETDPEERESLFLQSLSIRQEVFGEDHHLVARAYSNLAYFYADEGNPARADELYQQALAILERLPERTPNVPVIQQFYAQFLATQSRYAEAIRLFRQSHRNFVTHLGASHRWSLSVQGDLAKALQASGDPEQAEQEILAAIDVSRSAESVSPVVMADLYRVLAGVLIPLGRSAEVLDHLQSAVATYEADPEVHRDALADSYGLTAQAELALGLPADALDAAQRAVELSAETSPGRHAAFRALAALALSQGGDCPAGLELMALAQAAVGDLLESNPDRVEVSRRARDTELACGMP